jgi:ubiquinone/menaquinone biosynthesis C-methylase UbiE
MDSNTEIVTYYNELAKKYDQDRFGNSYGKFIDKQERNVLNKLLNNKNAVVLDLACGSGRLLNFAAIGVDASAEMIAVAKPKFPEKEFYVADADAIPLLQNSIDAIISFHLFMHLDCDKIDGILTEASRVLKQNGRLIFDIPSKKRRQLFNYKSRGWHGASSMSLKDLNELGGFEVKRTFGILFLPIHRFPKVLRPLFTKIDMFLAQSFLKEFSSYLIIELVKR